MKESGLIKNRARAAQLMAFDGMQYGKCRPTDIDLSMDWQGKYFVFVELKGVGVPITLGQKIHLTGLVDAIEAGGRQAVAIVATHDTPKCEHDVHVAESMVHSIYTGGSWEKIFNKKLDTLLHELHNAYQLTRGAA